MVLLFRKFWGWVLRAPGESSTSPASKEAAQAQLQLSLGEVFDRIPNDVFLQIMRLAGPRAAARTSTVCKGWRFLVSDDRLWFFFLQDSSEPWNTAAFAEMKLRSRLPSICVCGNTATVGASLMDINHIRHSFMFIYGQREKAPGSIIIDGGSGYSKYGWSKYASPSGRCATFLEFGSLESPSSLWHFFSTIYRWMQVKPSSQPVLVSVPICHLDDTESARASRMQLKETIFSVLFDMNVPAICAINQAVLALYAARQTSGIVVNIGFDVTSVVPILQGKIMHEVGVETVGQGSLQLTKFLKEKMLQRGLNFGSSYTVRTIKERLCYVAADYDIELRKNTEASIEVPGEGWFTLSKERFQTGEILFQPQIGGRQAMGLHSAVALCIDHCIDMVVGDDSWFKTIVLAGGTSCLPGLPERLEKELRVLLPPSISDGLRVIFPGYGADSAWIGAKIVSNVSTFTDTWCITKKQFRQKFHRRAPFIGFW